MSNFFISVLVLHLRQIACITHLGAKTYFLFDPGFLMQVLARRQIDTLTCQAWLSESIQLEEKVSLYFLQFLKEIDQLSGSYAMT